MMKRLSILILVFVFISCEKTTAPIGDEGIHLQTDKTCYTVNDSIRIYLINNSDRAVYSHPPGDWNLYKKVGREWELVYPLEVPTVLLPPNEWKANRSLIAVHPCEEEGHYLIQMYLSWDRDAKQTQNLGILSTQIFQIHGT